MIPADVTADRRPRGDVQNYFNTVVEPIIEGELGCKLTVVDGRQPYDHARIDQEIFAKLHRSSVVIADITGMRPNCLLELGYALGRGLPTMLMAKDGGGMLSIGACNVDDETQAFACEIKPTNENADPKALEVTGLSLAQLQKSGLTPEDAMRKFHTWAKRQAGNDETLVFVGLNAAFDGSFVNYYFHKFLGGNPFGFAALDIKAYYMGATGCPWSDTRSSRLSADLKPERQTDHTARATLSIRQSFLN